MGNKEKKPTKGVKLDTTGTRLNLIDPATQGDTAAVVEGIEPAPVVTEEPATTQAAKVGSGGKYDPTKRKSNRFIGDLEEAAKFLESIPQELKPSPLAGGKIPADFPLGRHQVIVAAPLEIEFVLDENEQLNDDGTVKEPKYKMYLTCLTYKRGSPEKLVVVASNLQPAVIARTIAPNNPIDIDVKEWSNNNGSGLWAQAI